MAIRVAYAGAATEGRPTMCTKDLNAGRVAHLISSLPGGASLINLGHCAFVFEAGKDVTCAVKMIMRFFAALLIL